MNEQSLSDAWQQDEVNDPARVLVVILAILPTLGISNRGDIRAVLEGMLKTAR
ncbi:MAG: hypothetical protein ACFB01_02830 [Cohaesibacteraceae bacterium]